MARMFRVLSTLCEMNFKEFYRDPVAAFFSCFFPLLFLLRGALARALSAVSARHSRSRRCGGGPCERCVPRGCQWWWWWY